MEMRGKQILYPPKPNLIELVFTIEELDLGPQIRQVNSIRGLDLFS